MVHTYGPNEVRGNAGVLWAPTGGLHDHLSPPLLAAGSSAFVAGTIGAPFVARAQQAEFTYKYANNLPATHPMNTRARGDGAAIKAETNGRFDIQIFPSSQLGSDTDTLSQVRSGGVEFFTLSGLILSTLVPARLHQRRRLRLPRLRRRSGRRWTASSAPMSAQQIAKANLVAMDKIWDNGFRQTTSSTKPINAPDDLKGFKIRVPVSPLWTSMFKAFDAAPTSINFNEVYSALQTKIVDGQENPLAIISTAKLYEVQKYCSLTNHMWDGFWFLANRRAWERLPQDLRTIVRQAHQRGRREAARRRRQAQRRPPEELAGRRAWPSTSPTPRLPRQAAQDRFLHRLEGQVWR